MAKIVWTETRPAGDANKVWRSVAADSDGSNLIAAVGNGRLYTSSNYGSSWAEKQPAGDANINWASVSSDSDGSNLLAADSVTSRAAYFSTNAGANWTRFYGDADNHFTETAINDDGTKMLFGCFGQNYTYSAYSHLSTNSGVGFSQISGLGQVKSNYDEAKMDADGSVLSFGAINNFAEPTYRYLSSDSGAAWASKAPNTTIVSNCISGDGAIQYVADTTGLYKSTDTGENWTDISFGGITNYYKVRCSANGQSVIVSAFGTLYISENGGTSWVEQVGIPSAIMEVSRNGAFFMAGAANGRLYTGVFAKVAKSPVFFMGV